MTRNCMAFILLCVPLGAAWDQCAAQQQTTMIQVGEPGVPDEEEIVEKESAEEEECAEEEESAVEVSEGKRKSKKVQRKKKVQTQQSETCGDGTIKWFHVDKTGTSFINIMMTYACDGMNDTASALSNGYTNTNQSDFRNKCSTRMNICPHVLHAHYSIGERSCVANEPGCKLFAGMFRQPEQRSMSNYNYQHEQDSKGNPVNEYFDLTENLLENSLRFAGCYVKMLIGQVCGKEEVSDEDMAVNTDAAKQVIADQFVFTGLTEEWELSVCLFHAVLGGNCHRREFLNVNMGNASKSTGYDTSLLGGWSDVYDGAIYADVTLRFAASTNEHGVNTQACRDVICAAAPDAFE